MQLEPIPALKDNYVWLLHDAAGHALVVDPGTAEPVARVLQQRGLGLSHILLTHHHADHIGGSVELARQFGARIIAPHEPRIPQADQRVGNGDTIRIHGLEAHFKVFAVPGHTRSHVVYFGEGILFSGDTLFSLGCGRLFEGTARDMASSLDRLSVLPGDTLLCCGHEYTLANAAFAQTVEPDNPALIDRIRAAQDLRDRNQPTLPVTLDTERQTNPFLRIDSAGVKDWAERQGVADNRVARLAALRHAKDHFTA